MYRGGSGKPYWVAFTPDGRTIVFAGGLGEPQMAAVAGGPVRRFAGQPLGSWSRDGRYAFTVVTGGTVRVEIGDQLARKARVVARMPYEEKGASGLGWLGDGSAVLYNGSASPGAELWAMRADGGGQRRLGGKAVMAPAWSRDGTKLAYASGDPAGGSRIVVADARGRKLSVVAPAASGTEPNDGNPSWSPDATRIAVEDIVAAGVSVVDVETGRRTPVAVDGVSPAWSPDGATIAFVDIDDRTAWGAAPDGADRHRLLPASAGKIMALAWSPDGKQLAFSTETGIYLGTPNGQAPAKLVVAARNPGRPSFAPRLPARVRGRCRQRPPVPLRLHRRRRRQRAQAAHDRPARQHRPGLEAGRRQNLSRRRERGGTACRAAPAACRPRGSGGRSRRLRRSTSCRRPRRRSPRS